MTRQLVIEVIGDADSFNKTTRDAVNGSDKMAGGFKGMALAGAAAGLAAGGVTMAIGFVTDALGDASEAAKEDQASQDKLALALKNTGQAQSLSTAEIEKAISANQAKGVSDSAQRDGISAFLDLTKSATDAMALNNAAVELSAAKGIDYAAAQKIVMSAATGRTAALAKAGVQVDKDISATELATAITNKYGGSLDRVATTQGGKNRIANEKMGEAMEKVGAIVNKVAAVALPVLADVLTFIVEKVMPPVADAFETLMPIVIKLGQIWVTVFGTIARITSTVFQGVVGAIKFAMNAVIDIINGVIGAINAIQVHVHVGPVNIDWAGLNLGYLPKLHAGGVVPGQPGQDVLSLLRAGETVTPAGLNGGGGDAPLIGQLIVQALDPAAAATAVVRAIDEWERRNGRRYVRASTA